MPLKSYENPSTNNTNNYTVDFLDAIFIKNTLPDFYKASYSDLSKEFNYCNEGPFPQMKNKTVVVKDIPDYIKNEIKDLPKNVKKLAIELYSGFSINFQDVNSLDSYLKSQFGNSSRYKLRRSIKKLESAFDIHYKMYFGEIDVETYHFIFNQFFKLLEIRSDEKGILNNRNIARKDYYRKTVLPLILQKKASFFVIYNGENPIDICLNFHKGKVVFQLIRTYDINYSKFNTGYIDLMKQIEWCLNNGISMITFSYGSFYWKKRWCNSNYSYHYDIFYDKSSIKSISSTLIKTSDIKIRHFLRERGMIDKFHSIKDKLRKKLRPSEEIEEKIEVVDFDENVPVEKELDLYASHNSHLVKYVYNFLFNFNEQEKNVKLFKLNDESNKFLVIGLQNKITICIN